jgi:hypothetical protein
MGKITWNTTAADIDSYEDEERGFYDGPVPPPSVYRARISEVVYKTFGTGSTGLRLTLDIDDPRKEKVQYKGARMWENLVDSEGSIFRVKQFLSAIGATGKDWANTVTDSDGKVTKIGKVRITDDMLIRVRTKIGNYQGNPKAEVAAFLPKSAEVDSDDDSDSAEDTDGEPAPF